MIQDASSKNCGHCWVLPGAQYSLLKDHTLNSGAVILWFKVCIYIYIYIVSELRGIGLPEALNADFRDILAPATTQPFLISFCIAAKPRLVRKLLVRQLKIEFLQQGLHP